MRFRLFHAAKIIKNHEKYLGIFGADLYEAQLPENRGEFGILMDAEDDSPLNRECRSKGYEIVYSQGRRTIGVNPSEMMRKGLFTYLVPNPAQPGEPQLLRRCVLAKWPFMRGFRFTATNLNKGEDSEILIKTKAGNLRVPIRALIHRDWIMVEDRMRNGSAAGASREAENILFSDEALIFRKALTATEESGAADETGFEPERKAKSLTSRQRADLKRRTDSIVCVLEGRDGVEESMELIQAFKKAIYTA